jgi:transcriptional regulator with XRE-family HTH domain
VPNKTPTFSHQLRRVREAADISLHGLAARTRTVPFYRLSLLERGLEPRADEVHALAAALGAAITERIEQLGSGRHAA